MEQGRETIGRGEEDASGKCKRQDSGKRGLKAKVDGEFLGLNRGKDGTLDVFEQDGAVYKGLTAELALMPIFVNRDYGDIHGRRMCQEECRSCRTQVSTVTSWGRHHLTQECGTAPET